MKRHLILLFTASVFTAVPAFAQQGKIIVIQPDGSIEEAEIPEHKAPPVEPEKAPALPAVEAVPAQSAPEQVEKKSATSPAELAVSPPAQVEKATKKKPKPEKKKAKTSQKKDKKAESPEISKPIPAPDALGQPMMPPRPVPQVAPGSYITKAQALDIALDYAPPAKSFDVLPRTYNDGRFIYVVRFQTEEGPRDILVDARDGSIINMKKR